MYNNWFNYAAIAIELAIILIMSFRRSVSTINGRTFLYAFISLCIATLSDAFHLYILNTDSGLRTTIYSPLFMNIVASIYFTAHILSAAIFTKYLYEALNIYVSRSKVPFLIYVPLLLAFVLIILNFFTGILFSHDNFLTYTRGKLVFTFYIIGIYYLIYVFVFLMIYRKNIPHDKFYALASLFLFSIISNAVQFFKPMWHVEMFANSLMALLIYLAVENPMDYIDSQTKLRNGNAFYQQMDLFIKHGRHTDMVIVSIDNVSNLEFELGKAQTDILIVEASLFLGKLSWDMDVYRLDRNIFVLTTKSGHTSDISDIALRIHSRFAEPFSNTENTVRFIDRCCTVSIPDNIKDIPSLRRCISLATNPRHMAEIRTATYNNIRFEEDAIRGMVDKQLRSVIARKAFVFKYYPVYNTSVVHCNTFFAHAYFRFDASLSDVYLGSKIPGLLSFEEFCNIAERNGTLRDIHSYALDHICAFIHHNRILDKGINRIRILLPISELVKKDETEIICSIIDKHKIPHSSIEFALYETELEINEEVLIKSMLTMRNSGFNFVLANYGSGYTNTGMIIKMPITGVILDKKLVHIPESANREKATAILDGTIDMLSRLGLRICADGIDNDSLKAFADSKDIHEQQGLYYSIPMNEEDLLNYLGKEAQ